MFTRVQQASIGLQWLMIYKHDHKVLKNQPLVHGRPGFHRDLKQTVEHRHPFIFQNNRLSPGSRGDLKKKRLSPSSHVYKSFEKFLKQEVYDRF